MRTTSLALFNILALCACQQQPVPATQAVISALGASAPISTGGFTESAITTNPIVIATETQTTPRNVIFSLSPSAEVDQNLAGLQLHWEFIQGTNLEDVRAMLVDPAIRNLMIITDAAVNGQIVDSYSNAYPPTFFNQISPSLQSLSIYSNYGNAVRQLYALDAKLGTPSLAIHRLVLTPTGAETFPEFLRNVDTEVATKLPSDIPSPTKYFGGCQLTLSGIQPVVGDYGVFLAGGFIFTLRSGQVPPAVFEFNCGLLINNQPELTIVNLRTDDVSDLSLQNPIVRFQTQMSDHGFILTSTPRTDGSIRSMDGLLD